MIHSIVLSAHFYNQKTLAWPLTQLIPMLKNTTYTIISLLSISCNNEKPNLDYCTMLDNDQSHINSDKNSPTYQSDREKRNDIYLENFNQIIEYSKKYGFPQIERKQAMSDSCKYKTISATFVHIAQSNINQFFIEEVKSFFLVESKKNTELKKIIGQSIIVTLNTNDLCELNKGQLVEFVDEMDLNDFRMGDTLSILLQNKETIKCINTQK